ncbi:MAG: hypothetical protein AB8B65_01025 [Kordia sp.]|uniref:hypothetical protein n=1 Tax=Kordia sp. TaxID=1965332 RepID=UPI00385A70C4
MKSLRRIVAIGMAVSFFGLMSFTDESFEQTNTDTTNVDTNSVRGKWGPPRRIRNADGSVSVIRKCINGGTDCIVGTVSINTVWPIGN